MATAELTKITVNVTAKDIKAGEIGHCKKCPIALALQRVFPRFDIQVGSRWAEIDNGETGFNPTLPDIARDFIDAFDGGEPAKPFAFELSVPVSYVPTPA